MNYNLELLRLIRFNRCDCDLADGYLRLQVHGNNQKQIVDSFDSCKWLVSHVSTTIRKCDEEDYCYTFTFTMIKLTGLAIFLSKFLKYVNFLKYLGLDKHQLVFEGFRGSDGYWWNKTPCEKRKIYDAMPLPA